MRKIPLYEEALNVFTLKLVEQSATSDAAKRVQINAALKDAYSAPETAGIQADSLKDIINYKWAIVVIGLQIAYSEIHEGLLSEFSIHKKDIVGFDFQAKQKFAIDFDSLLAASFISRKQISNACAELFKSQLFFNYHAEQLSKKSVSPHNYADVATDDFVFNLLNAATVDRNGILQEANVVNFDISGCRFFNEHSKNTGKGKHLKDNLVQLLEKHSWSSDFLLKTHNGANGSRQNNALYLAKYFRSAGGGTSGINSLDKGLSSQFISMLDEDIRSEYVEIISRLGSHSEINSSLFNSGVEYSYLRDNLWMFESVAKGGDSMMFTGLLCCYVKHTKNSTPEYALYFPSQDADFSFFTAKRYMRALHELNEAQLSSVLGQSSGFEKYLDYIFSYHSYLNKFKCNGSFFISPTLNGQEENKIAAKIIKQLEVITDNVIKKYADTNLGDVSIMVDRINSAISKHGENEIALAILDIVNKRVAMMTIEEAVDSANGTVFEPEPSGFNVY